MRGRADGIDIHNDDLEGPRGDELHADLAQQRPGWAHDEHARQIDTGRNEAGRVKRGLGIDPRAPRVRTTGLGRSDRGQRDAGRSPELARRGQLDDTARQSPVGQ